ncbi:hypothetical protein HDU76_009833, partial [Blyttiomyces sp. JEL0837]
MEELPTTPEKKRAREIDKADNNKPSTTRAKHKRHSGTKKASISPVYHKPSHISSILDNGSCRAKNVELTEDEALKWKLESTDGVAMLK